MLKKVILTFFNVASPAHVRTRSRRLKRLRARVAGETSLSRASRVFFNTLAESQGQSPASPLLPRYRSLARLARQGIPASQGSPAHLCSASLVAQFAAISQLLGAPAAAGEPATQHQRIVTLAPHLAELVFAVGAGERLVGVSAYTDYPEAAASLPVVSDAFAADQERLALLEPDLLLAWESGTPAHIVDRLARAGYRVEVIRTRGLQDVRSAMLRIGALTGQESTARRVAGRFRNELARLDAAYDQSPPIRVFYQISERPLYTVSGDHYISEIIAICGGINIFAELSELAPMVAVEAVLERDPEVLLAGGYGQTEAFGQWRRWPELAANRYGNQLLVPAGQIGRATPRLAAAAQSVCEALDTARENRRLVGARQQTHGGVSHPAGSSRSTR